MDIGRKIKDLRSSRHLEQKDLAELLNVSPKTISSWEVGRWKNGSSVLQRVYDNGLESNRRKYNDVVNDFIESEFQ